MKRKSLLALLVAAAVAAPAAQAMFLGKAFTLAPDFTWKLEVSPSAGNGSGTAVTILEVRGTTLAVLDKLAVAEGASVSRSYKAVTKSVGRIIITFDQPNQASMTLVRITQDNPSSTFGSSNKFELPVIGDHAEWVIDVAP